MGMARCMNCETVWDALLAPLCSHCEQQRLLAAPNLISEKHDPRLLPLAGLSYRSCLSLEFVDNVASFVAYATASGSWFYDTIHATWSHFTPEPLGRIPGSGIHAGDPTPDHALDGLMFANVLDDPHAYAVDQLQVRQEIRDGKLFPLGRCQGGSDNLCIPGEDVCVLHAVQPRAHAVRWDPAQQATAARTSL
jgi:hypothetical protein